MCGLVGWMGFLNVGIIGKEKKDNNNNRICITKPRPDYRSWELSVAFGNMIYHHPPTTADRIHSNPTDMGFIYNSHIISDRPPRTFFRERWK